MRKSSFKTKLRVKQIIRKALKGKDLNLDEGTQLLKSKGKDLKALVSAADKLREETVGKTVKYIINRNINFTNICTCKCNFCAFYRLPGDPDAYILDPEQVKEKTRGAVEKGATEVCIQGGLHPSLALKDYISMIRAVRKVSKNIHIHAYSPAEINHISQNEGLDIKKVIKILRDEGLNSVPGTAAEVLIDRVRKIICPNKISADDWEYIIRTCHELEIPTTATIMYGHIEKPREIASHLIKLRNIQIETQGFTELVPLAFACENTALKKTEKLPKLSPADHLKIHATSRLMLNNYFNNIQSSWVKLGPELAQRTLNAGANDLSGTLMEENITRAAGGEIQEMPPRKLEELILKIGRTPIERTTTYEAVIDH